jgi:hypothetical protein
MPPAAPIAFRAWLVEGCGGVDLRAAFKLLQERHLLGPFLQADDAFSLAACAKHLRAYSREMGELCLDASHLEPPERFQALPLKLAELQGLVSLQLSDRRLVVAVERAFKVAPLRLLRRLDLTGSTIGDVGMRRLLNGLEPAKEEVGLQELILGQSLLTPKGLGYLAEALKRGALPELRVLDLSASPLIGKDGMRTVAAAMEPGGGLNKLECLVLADADIGWEGLEALGAALAKKGCPELRVIDAMGTIDATPGKVSTPPLLLDAIREGCVPKLRELRIGTTRAHPGSPKMKDTEHTFLALGQGCSKGLEKLHLLGFEVDKEVAEEVAGLLRDDVLQTLQELHLGHADITEEAIELICGKLREGKAPALRSLVLDCNVSAGFSADAFRALGEALEDGALPALERLVIRLYKERSAAAVMIEAIQQEGGDDEMMGQSSDDSADADAVGDRNVLAGLLGASPSLKILRLGMNEEEDGGVAAAEEDGDYVIGVNPEGDDTGDEGDDVPSVFWGSWTQKVGRQQSMARTTYRLNTSSFCRRCSHGP